MRKEKINFSANRENYRRSGDVNLITAEWADDKVIRYLGLSATEGIIDLDEAGPTDIFDQPSDDNIVRSIVKDLSKSGYKELQRYHFDEAANGRLIIMESRNPYLDHLAQNTSLSSLFDEHEPNSTEAVNFFGRFSSTPVQGPLVIESLQAYMSQDRQIFVSGYDGQNNIISKWKPLDAVSINYGAVGSGVNIKSLANQLLNGSLGSLNPDNERLDEAGHHIDRIINGDRFGLLPMREIIRNGKKILFYKKIVDEAIKQIVSVDRRNPFHSLAGYQSR